MSHHCEEFTIPNDITIASLFEFLEFKYIPVIAERDNEFYLRYYSSPIDIENTLFSCIKFIYNLL